MLIGVLARATGEQKPASKPASDPLRASLSHAQDGG
jgi:hypothetical protein